MLSCTTSRPCTRITPGHTPQHPVRTGIQLLAALATLVTLVIVCFKATHIYRTTAIGSLAHGRFSRKIIAHQRSELSTDVVYFNNELIMQQLGCPEADKATVHLNYTCFYHDPGHAAAFTAEEILLDAGTTCAAIYKPQPADYGRPWCIRQTRMRHVTDQIPQTEKLHIPGLTLINGMLSGPNPTHQLNIHFYYIWLMMKRNKIRMGDLNLVMDCPDPLGCIGSYGHGLAQAFGTVRYLHELPKMTSFETVKWSLPGGFPFDIHFYELDKSLDCNMVELIWGVKQHYSIDPRQPTDVKRVVIAQRKPTESRRLDNTTELVTALETKGYNVSLVTFGDLTFEQQLHAVQDAAVLVGVTGSDLVNLVFLPLVSTVVEIFPTAQGVQVFTPELWHLAQMSGKHHVKYVSPYNSTLLYDKEGNVWGDRPVHQVNSTSVHVPSLAALVESAVLTASMNVRTRVHLDSDKTNAPVVCSVQDVEWYVAQARDWD